MPLSKVFCNNRCVTIKIISVLFTQRKADKVSLLLEERGTVAGFPAISLRVSGAREAVDEV